MNISSKEIETFRLAAVLYADNNYEVNPKTILRKIVESIFLDNGNSFLHPEEIIEAVDENYNLLFSEQEVVEVVRKHADKNFLVNEKKD